MSKLNVVLMVVVAALTGCATIGDLFDREQEVDLSQVPPPALDAAKGAVKDIVLTEAEVKEEDGQIVYDIEGTADGKTYGHQRGGSRIRTPMLTAASGAMPSTVCSAGRGWMTRS